MPSVTRLDVPCVISYLQQLPVWSGVSSDCSPVNQSAWHVWGVDCNHWRIYYFWHGVTTTSLLGEKVLSQFKFQHLECCRTLQHYYLEKILLSGNVKTSKRHDMISRQQKLIVAKIQSLIVDNTPVTHLTCNCSALWDVQAGGSIALSLHPQGNRAEECTYCGGINRGRGSKTLKPKFRNISLKTNQ